MSARRLIVNADDFGFSEGVTDAIIDAHRDGIITSTTLMVNMPAAKYAADLAPSVPGLGIGVHLNLTEGAPTAPAEQVGGLLGEDGLFPGNAAQGKNLWRAGHLKAQVEIEVEAQMQRALALGIRPTHFDSHHGINKMPIVRQALCRVLKRHGVPRARTTLSRHRRVPGSGLAGWKIWATKNARRAPSIAIHAWSHVMFKLNGITTPRWKATRSMGVPAASDPKSEILACISAVPRGVSEILLHPGRFSADEDPSEWRRRTWAEDTPICFDEDVKQRIRDMGIELIHFGDL